MIDKLKLVAGDLNKKVIFIGDEYHGEDVPFDFHARNTLRMPVKNSKADFIEIYYHRTEFRWIDHENSKKRKSKVFFVADTINQLDAESLMRDAILKDKHEKN